MCCVTSKVCHMMARQTVKAATAAAGGGGTSVGRGGQCLAWQQPSLVCECISEWVNECAGMCWSPCLKSASVKEQQVFSPQEVTANASSSEISKKL